MGQHTRPHPGGNPDNTPAAQAPDGVHAAEHELACGSAPAAVGTGRRVIEASAGPAERAAAALVTGCAMLLCGPEADAREFLSREATAAEDADPAAAALMLAHAAVSALRTGLTADALAMAERASSLSAGTTERVEALARAVLASVLVADSQTSRARAVLPTTEELLRLADPSRDGRLVALSAGMALVWGEDLDRATELLVSLETANREAGTLSVLPSILMPLALHAHRRCRWHEAEAYAREGLDIARRAGQQVVEPLVASVLTTVEAALGRAVSCRSRALGLLDSPAGSTPVVRAAALSALGLLELGEGRLEAAAHWFEVLAASLPGPNRPHPGVIMWEADLAEVYIGLGRSEQAERTLERLEARSQMSRSGRASAAVVRCRASLVHDDSEAEELFARALELYGDEKKWLFARARTVMAMGARRLRAGRVEEGRRALREAGAQFDAIGASGWSRRVVELLARSLDQDDAPRQEGEPLSPTEAQVAMAAALGAAVPDIASALYISETQASALLRTALDKLGLDEPTGVDMLPLVQRLTAGRSPLHVPAASPPPAAGPPAPADQPPTPAGRPAPVGQPPTPAGQPPTPAGVTIRMLGGFSIEADGQPGQAGDGVTAQAVKLVALAGKVSVEELIDKLWPDGDLEVGRTRLRSLLSRMRRQFGPLLERRGSWVVLADHVTVDVEIFERHAQEAQVAAAAGDERAGHLAETAADLYAGELLPADRHLDFTTGARERLRRRYLAVVDLATDHACRQQLLETAVRRIEDALAAEPYDEHLYLRAAVILADAGRPSEALSLIRRAEAALNDLGMGLGPEAVQLRARLGSQSGAPQP